jgi:hypothetical protein
MDAQRFRFTGASWEPNGKRFPVIEPAISR